MTSLDQCCLKIDLLMKNKLLYHYTTKLDICKEIFLNSTKFVFWLPLIAERVRSRIEKVIGNGT